jgi:hypothetical protein
MKWVLVLVYVGGLGTPVTKTVESFGIEKDCRWVAADFMKKNPGITASCDYREPPKEMKQ